MNNKNEILSFLKSNKQILLDKYNVTKIGLFGSYAKDTANENSDIDILIQSSKKDFFLRDDLKEYLEMHFNKTVDIGYIDSIRKFYKDKIQEDIIYV